MSVFNMPCSDMDRKKQTFSFIPTQADRRQAQRNHGQTLERLRERGGMDWGEMWAIITGKALFDIKLHPVAYGEYRRVCLERQARDTLA